MRPSFRVAHKPLIFFIGKRQWPTGPQPQRPHPAAPEQFKETFPDFLEKHKSHLSSSSSKSTRQNTRGLIFNDFWEAPGRLARPKISQLDDTEIDAVLSGGASLR